MKLDVGLLRVSEHLTVFILQNLINCCIDNFCFFCFFLNLLNLVSNILRRCKQLMVLRQTVVVNQSFDIATRNLFCLKCNTFESNRLRKTVQK